MLEILDDTKEFILEDVLAEASLEPIYKKILNNRNEDKSIELWVCWARIKRILVNLDNLEEDNVDDGGSWYKIYGFLFDDDDETDRTIAAKTFFLLGWLEITIFKKDWIENTIIGKNYSQFIDKIHQQKTDFLKNDQFFLSEHLDYSIDSLEKWQNYLIYKEKIPKDIESLQGISENQKDVLRSIIIKDEEITDLEAYINDTIDDSFSPKQQKILGKIIKKSATQSSIKKYINELKLKVDNAGINSLDQIVSFVENNEKLFFVKNPRFIQKKQFSKKPWKVFVIDDLCFNYHGKEEIDDVVEKKFPKYQSNLKTINFQTGPGGKRPSIANMITWINYLSTINYRDNQMKDDDSIFEYEKKKHEAAKADKTIIPVNIKAILSKISKIGYKGLVEEDKDKIDQGIKDSPKIKWEFEAAKLTFTENRIVENYHKRKALRDAAKEKAFVAQKEGSLWKSFLKILQNFSEQMTFPKAAVSLVTAGMAAIIISYSIYFSGPAKFNINLTVTGRMITGTTMRGEPEYKDVTLEPNSILKSGDSFIVKIKSDQDAFYYLVFKDSQGIFDLKGQGKIKSGDTLRYPVQEEPYTLDSIKGIETIILILSGSPIDNFDVKKKELNEKKLKEVFPDSDIKEFSFIHE